jgi:hypothetical protein
MLNADPDGLLASVASRHKSGLMGGLTYSVTDDSSSSSLTVNGNTFTGKIGQIHNDNDIDSLILVQGGSDTVKIYSNVLAWEGSSLSDTASSMSDSTAVDGSTVKVYTQGIHIAGEANAVYLQDNSFDTDDISSNYGSDAVLLDGTDQSSLNLGTLDTTVTIADTVNSPADFDAYKVLSAVFDGYATSASDEYGTVVTTGSMGSSDLQFSTSDIIA